nr:MAG TPA: hypothetical protein [Caudoviricetes sp.]
MISFPVIISFAFLDIKYITYKIYHYTIIINEAQVYNPKDYMDLLII